MDWVGDAWGAVWGWLENRPWGSWGEWFSGFGAISAVGAAFWLQHREHGRQDKLLADQWREQRLAEGRRLQDRVRDEVRLSLVLYPNRNVEALCISVATSEKVRIGMLEIRDEQILPIVSLDVDEYLLPNSGHRDLVEFEHSTHPRVSLANVTVTMDVYGFSWVFEDLAWSLVGN